MPAALPGSTSAQNLANPSAGNFVVFDPLSGPKGSPFDKDNAGNASTGALATGIGYGDADIINQVAGYTVPQSITRAGFDDDEQPGLTKPDNTSSANSTLMYIGGGRNVITPANGNGVSAPSPYTAGFSMCGAGNGGSRDGGAGPAFTGFPMKMVTAVGAVANGAAIEAGWVNRSGIAMVATQSAFGSGAAANTAPA